MRVTFRKEDPAMIAGVSRTEEMTENAEPVKIAEAACLPEKNPNTKQKS